jgi:hypothetical protein
MTMFDEHSAGEMLFAGFRAAIATLWLINVPAANSKMTPENLFV